MIQTIKRITAARSSSAAVGKNFAIRFLLLAINLCTGVLVARSLGPAGRGEQSAMALWPPLIATLATLGIPTALNFHSRRNPERAKQLYMGSAVTMLTVGLIASALGAAFMPLILHGYNAYTIRTAQWFMLFAPETLVASVARAHLESQDQFTRSTLGVLYPVAGTLVALIALRLTDHLTPTTAALSYIVPPAIQAVWVVSRLWQSSVFALKRLPSDVKLLLPYGLKCYGSDVLNALSSQMDLVVIVAFLSPVELGLYTVALSLSRVLNVVHSSVITILFSRASALQSDDAIALVGRAARLSTVTCLVLAAMLLVVARFVVPVFYGTPFNAAIPIFNLLVIEALLGGLVNVLFQAFMATGRPAIVTIIQVCWTGTAIAMLIVLVPRMNLTGAATALLVAGCVRLVLVLMTFPVVLRRQIPNIIIDASDVAYVRTKLHQFRVSRKHILTDGSSAL